MNFEKTFHASAARGCSDRDPEQLKQFSPDSRVGDMIKVAPQVNRAYLGDV